MHPGQSLLKILLLAGLMMAATAQAANPVRYVNDHLIITLRAGEGDEYRIIKSLPSGTRLELLEQEPESKFAKVRTEDGTEGWVRSWYLSDTPTARLLLDDAQRKVERLENEGKKLQLNNRELSKDRDALQKQVADLSGDKKRLEQENAKLKDVASRPLELESSNNRLQADNDKLQEENRHLASENSELRQSTVQKWFMAGSGVLGFGIILGLILPRLRSRRSSGW
jgi:SH3 domain protein